MTPMALPRERLVERSVDMAMVQRLSEELAVSELLARILVGRGLVGYEECRRYFRPDVSQFHDPFLFVSMKPAVDRIARAIHDNEAITIFGDYDVDGITATAMVLRVLKAVGARCDYYLPNRLTEGYGLSADGIEVIASRGTTLIITVDCGITANEEISQARTLGLDVIVTDHHESHGELPPAFAIINPKVGSCGYPDKNLAGVGVALKLCHAVALTLGKSETLWQDQLDLASLGTAADIVPLTGENRIIASLGFARLSKTTNIGLRALMEQQDCGSGRPLSTRDVVFQLAPSLNATGRLGDSARGVELLLTNDDAVARVYARELAQANIERRALDKAVQEDAVTWVSQHGNPAESYGLVASSVGWHAGVIGIAASRVVEAFYRPTFLFSIGPDGMAKGSGRSVKGVHLCKALEECADLCVAFGGHAAAAGATLKASNIDAFRLRFNEAVSKQIRFSDLIPIVEVDAAVEVPQLTPRFFGILKQMEPFGPGNPRPVLLCKNISCPQEVRMVGANHIKMRVQGNGSMMDAIAFNFGSRLPEIKSAKSFDIAFSLDENEWNGRTSLQMKVKGLSV
jgi:single-stranded-DNA-specific exonuclease